MPCSNHEAAVCGCSWRKCLLHRNCSRYREIMKLKCFLPSEMRCRTLSGSILRKFKARFHKQKEVHGGDPMIQSGLLAFMYARACSRSLLRQKFHGVPSGFIVRRSNALRPLRLRDRRLFSASLHMDPPPYISKNVTAAS